LVAKIVVMTHTRAMTATTGERDERANAQTAGGDEAADIPADTFAARLVLARHHAGRLSIEKAAALCDINPGNWAHWEGGRRPRDKVEEARKISEALRIDFDWLLFGGPLVGQRGRPVSRRVTTGYPRTSTVRPPDQRSSGHAGGAVRPNAPRRPQRRSNPVPIPDYANVA
jgi:hypothetical protein